MHMIKLTREELDELLRLRDRLTCKQIDAGCCQTNEDYRRRDEAQEAFDKLYYELVDR